MRTAGFCQRGVAAAGATGEVCCVGGRAPVIGTEVARFGEAFPDTKDNNEGFANPGLIIGLAVEASGAEASGIDGSKAAA